MTDRSSVICQTCGGECEFKCDLPPSRYPQIRDGELVIQKQFDCTQCGEEWIITNDADIDSESVTRIVVSNTTDQPITMELDIDDVTRTVGVRVEGVDVEIDDDF